MIFRPALLDLLRAGSGRKLTLLSAPTGYGKTTLLTQWRASEEETRPFAWVSLDAADGDPMRLSAYIVEAVERVEPGFGDDLRGLLQSPGTDFNGAVLPRLVNALAALPREIVIVLDDYHLLERSSTSNPTNYVVEHLPETVQLVVSTQTEPPIPIGRLRASGELVEIRSADLCFGLEVTRDLLRTEVGIEPDDEDLEALLGRTEGWPAGIYLAALALRRSFDPGADIREFTGSARHVVDYLTEEVLERQAPETRRFLLRTSVLERFNASLCDAVTDGEDSAGLLGGLERSNLFLVPLDENREWYRYHRLFADLLRVELNNSELEILPVLHRRAADWYLEAGDIGEAIRHTLDAGDFDRAGELIARYWLVYLGRGRTSTLSHWLAEIPDADVAGYPPLALVQTWLSAFGGDVEALKSWLSIAENGNHSGPLPDGTVSLESGVALIRAGVVFGNAQRAHQAARRAVELETDPDGPWYTVARTVLGYSLYWTGALDESRGVLEESLRLGRVSTAPLTSTLLTMGFLSLAEYDLGNNMKAESVARRAIDYAEERGLGESTEVGVSCIVLGLVEAGRGHLVESEQLMERGVALRRPLGGHNGYPHALLAYAPVRQALGDRAGARALFEEARDLIGACEDPGLALVSMLDQTGRKLRLASRKAEWGQQLSEVEQEVLRSLDSGLRRQEIADSLYLSVNTVKTHLRSIYRKLGVSSREEAVERARTLGHL